jgi:hypothetical protein
MRRKYSAAPECKHKSRGVRRFLDMGDAKSTSNMWKTKRCWGDEVVTSADQVKNANEVWVITVKGALDPIIDHSSVPVKR